MPRKVTPPRYPLNLRTNATLRDQLIAAAKATGRSLTQEATARLARSFDQDLVFGDAEIRRTTIAMALAFELAGRHRSGSKAGWTRDRDAYRAGMFGVIDALLIGMPDVTDEEIAIEIEGLKSSLLSRILRRRLQDQEQEQPQPQKRRDVA